MLKSMVFLGLTLLALSCGAGDNSISSLDIVGGQVVPEESPAYKSTVSLARFRNAGLQSFCSGTLIARNLVLTAAHCVESFKAKKDFVVLFGPSESEAKPVTLPVAAFQTYRQQDGSRYFPNFDVAWVKLEGEAPAGYEPAEILRSSDQLKPLLNQTDAVLLSGYGRTKTNCLPSTPGCSGQRLQVQTYLRRFVNTSHFSQLMVIGPKSLSGTCTGDSGGSAFAQVKGRWYLLGALNGKNLALNSSAVWDSERICESGESIYTFAGAYVDWLQNSSGVTLKVDKQLNPNGPGLLPIDDPNGLGPNPDLARMLAYHNPNDPLWATAEALISSFGEAGKREIPELLQVVTDPHRAAAAMARWTVFTYTGVGFDYSNLVKTDRQLSDLRPIIALKNLQKLELIGNRFADLASLGQLENLQELTLSNNYDFSSKNPLPYDFRFLARLKKLRVLNLSTNSGNLDLAAIPWETLTQLEVLDLSANDQVQLEAVKFSKLPRLHTLIVANAGLSNIEALAEARSLRNLDLRNNSIQDIGVLAQLPHIQKLDLSLNEIADFAHQPDPITDLLPGDLPEQPREPGVDEQNFHDLSPLLALKELQVLNLANNKLKRVDLLAGLPHLQRLVLDSNQLIDITALAAIQGLWVSAVGNPDLPKVCPIPEGQCVFEKP